MTKKRYHLNSETRDCCKLGNDTGNCEHIRSEMYDLNVIRRIIQERDELRLEVKRLKKIIYEVTGNDKL